MMGWFKKKDPICGMKEENGKGFYEDDNWFCSEHCLKEYGLKVKKTKKGSCCGGH